MGRYVCYLESDARPRVDIRDASGVSVGMLLDVLDAIESIEVRHDREQFSEDNPCRINPGYGFCIYVNVGQLFCCNGRYQYPDYTCVHDRILEPRLL